jgi:dihydroorotate dehydrogenase (NAD+) catalytic subunit
MIELAPNNPYGLSLCNPVIAAAGCLGYGVEYARMLDLSQLGAVVTHGTSAQRRRAAPSSRLAETASGLLSIGPWPNPGLDYVLNRHAPQWATWQTPVILSLSAQNAQEYQMLASALEGVEGVAAVEIYLSEPERAESIISAVRNSTMLPIVAKLPAIDDIAALAQAVAQAGADCLVVAAGPNGTIIGNNQEFSGMLCGPAIYPQTLQRLKQVVGQVDIPIIAGGGITAEHQVRECLALGASAVQVGTLILDSPHALIELAKSVAIASET